MKNIVILSMAIFTIFGCKSQQLNNKVSVTEPPVKEQFVAALSRIVIYKTTKDYKYNVPVILSDDKTRIVSYPHPSDLIFDNRLALPSALNKGYLLDNRGIQKNVAFLKYTYEEYSKLKDVPALQELYSDIINKDPLTELWNCGTKASFTDLQKQLNESIDKNLLPEKFKRIK